MLKQFNRLIVIALIVAVAIYITLLNSEPAKINLGGDTAITSTAGVLYLALFAAGCFCASLIALFWGIKGYFRERRLRLQAQAERTFVANLTAGHDLMLIEEWGAAQGYWEEILTSDSQNSVARVELSRCLEMMGDPKEALRIIDSARTQGIKTIGVLARAAELNQTLGNLVGAKDNLALLSEKSPARCTLRKLRDVQLSLGAYREALIVQEKLESLGLHDKSEENFRAKLALHKINNTLPETERGVALTRLLKENPSYYPALLIVGSLALERGDVAASADNFMRAAKITKSHQHWKAAVNAWLHGGTLQSSKRFEGALGVAKTACKTQTALARVEAELLLIEILLAASRFHEAEPLIERFPSWSKTIATALPSSLEEQYLIVKGSYLVQVGRSNDAASLWKELAECRGISPESPIATGTNLQARETPSPELSTP